MANKNVNDFQYPLFNDVLEGMEKKNDSGGSALPAVTSADNGKVLGVVNGEWAKDSNSVVLPVPSVIQPYLAQAVQGAIQTALQNQTSVAMSRTNIASDDIAATLSYINTLHEYANSGKQVWTTLGDNNKTLTISLGFNGYACMLQQTTTYGTLVAYCTVFANSNNAAIDIYGIFTPAT